MTFRRLTLTRRGAHEPGCVSPVVARSHLASERPDCAASTGPARTGSPPPQLGL